MISIQLTQAANPPDYEEIKVGQSHQPDEGRDRADFASKLARGLVDMLGQCTIEHLSLAPL